MAGFAPAVFGDDGGVFDGDGEINLFAEPLGIEAHLVVGAAEVGFGEGGLEFPALVGGERTPSSFLGGAAARRTRKVLAGSAVAMWPV